MKAFATLLMATAALASSSSSSSSSPRDSDFIVDAPYPYEQRRHKCNPVEQVKSLIQAFNENRYKDMAEYYTEDALRFDNGILSQATMGRPIVADQYVQLRLQYPMRVEARQITRSGDWAVAVTGQLFIGGAVEPARAMGLGIVYEFREGDRCLIQTERFHYSHDTIAFERWRSAACMVFKPLSKTSLCDTNAETGGDDTPSVDLAQRTRDAWTAFANQQPAALAAFFAPNAVVYVGDNAQEDDTWGSAAFWTNYFSFAAWEGVVIEDLIVEGSTVQVAAHGTLFLKESGKRMPAYAHFEFKFDSAGVITRVQASQGSGATLQALEMAAGMGFVLSFWIDSGSAKAASDAVAVAGPPTRYTDSGDGSDHAFWGTSTLLANSAPSWLTQLWAMDQHTKQIVTNPVNGAKTERNTYLYCQAYLPVSAAKVDEVRAFSTSVIYDVLAERLWSNAQDVDQCAVDFWFSARIAAGQITLSDAQAQYAQALANVASSATFRDQVYAELGTLIG